MGTCRSLMAAIAPLLLAAWSAPVGAAEVDAGLPPNAEIVLAINVKQVLHAPVFKQHVLPALRQACQTAGPACEALASLGFDPFHDLDRLSAGWTSKGKDQESVLVLRGRFDTARFHARAKKAAREHPDLLASHRAGDLEYYCFRTSDRHGSLTFGAGASSTKGPIFRLESKGSLLGLLDGNWVALPTCNALVAASSEELLKAACERVAGKAPDERIKPMRHLLAELEGKQTVVFAMHPAPRPAEKKQESESSEAPKEIAEMFARLLAVWKEPLSPQSPEAAFAADRKIPVHLALQESEAPQPQDEVAEQVSDLGGTVALGEDLQLRCTLRASNADAARDLMHTLKDFRVRLDGLATLLAGTNKDYAFLKEIPRSFAAVRKGCVILIEGHLTADTLEKLIGMVEEGVKND
jgi:hypothetical protein